MLNFIAKLFGTKSEKDIKRMMPLVEQTKREGETLLTVSNDELREQTRQVERRINESLATIDQQIAGLHQQVADNPGMDLHEKDALFQQMDSLEDTRNKELEKVLIEVLPKAFAIVRETARRFKENESIEVTASES